jgi:hypothetical protein
MMQIRYNDRKTKREKLTQARQTQNDA